MLQGAMALSVALSEAGSIPVSEAEELHSADEGRDPVDHAGRGDAPEELIHAADHKVPREALPIVCAGDRVRPLHSPWPWRGRP